MAAIEISRKVDAPAPEVWQLVTDLDSAAERIGGIDSLERLAGPEFGIGTRWRETRRMFGKEATEEMEVVEIEPGSSYVVAAGSRGTSYRSAITVTPEGEERCTLGMTFDARAEGTLAKVMAGTIGRLFAGATRKALRQDLDDIAAAAESR